MNNTTIGLYLNYYYTIELDDSDTDYYYIPRKSIRFQYYHLGKPIEEILSQDRKMKKEINKGMKRSKVNKFFKNLR